MTLLTESEVEKSSSSVLEFEDFLSLGRLWFVKGRRWGGTKHISDRDLGIDLGLDAKKRTSRMLVLIPSSDFSLVDTIVRQAKSELESCSASLPMGFSVPLRLVSSANSKRLEESFEAMRKQYATNADELCFTEYPKQKVLGRGRVLTTLRRLYNDYIKKADPNIKLETYEEQINRILDKAYPSPEALRASMSLQGGPFSIQLPDNMSKGAPMEQVMKSMVEGLRNSLKDRLVQAKEVFLNGKRLGDTSVQALTRDLEVFSNQNILGDAVIENAVRSALDYIQGLATDEPIKQVRTTVASVMSEIALSVDTTGGIAEVRRNLEGSRRRRLK